MKTCVACGMPMKEASEFAMNDLSKDYCIHCAREDGTMQSFGEKKTSLTNFIVKTQGFDESVAAQIADSMMMKLPAWAGYYSDIIIGRDQYV